MQAAVIPFQTDDEHDGRERSDRAPVQGRHGDLRARSAARLPGGSGAASARGHIAEVECTGRASSCPHERARAAVLLRGRRIAAYKACELAVAGEGRRAVRRRAEARGAALRSPATFQADRNRRRYRLFSPSRIWPPAHRARGTGGVAAVAPATATVARLRIGRPTTWRRRAPQSIPTVAGRAGDEREVWASPQSEENVRVEGARERGSWASHRRRCRAQHVRSGACRSRARF